MWLSLFSLVLLSASFLHAATITIVNLDDVGEGFNDPTPAAPVGGNNGTTVGQQRLIVFERAAQIWGARLVSSVPIRVAAKFDPLSCTANQGVLGAAGPIVVIRDFAGAPLPNVWYTVAQANALAGEDLDPDNDDIEATFNSNLGQPNCLATLSWYYGLDGDEPPNSIDLLDTIVHEFAHGLGFLSLVNLTTGGRLNGLNDAYIMHLEDHATGETYPQMTDMERRNANTAGTNLHWVGSNVVALSGILSTGRGPGGHVEIYAPDPVESGSSVSHFSDRLIPDELMEPFATPTSDMRLTVESFKDLGWRIAPSGPSIIADSSALISESCGAANGVIDPSESVSVRMSLRNVGSGATSNLVATLLATGGVSAPGSPQNYGALSANGPEVARTFSFIADQRCGGTLTMTLQLQDGTNDLGTVSFNFNVGRTVSFTNSTPINLPLSGAGSPYPSTINVTGQPSPVSTVTVRLFDVGHSNPDDLDVLLVGPNGQAVVLMSDTGGGNDISGVDLTFDDSAAALLPDSSRIVSGTFRPTNIGVDDMFASPAPAGPYGSALGAFAGISANGAWSLYLFDDSHPRSGAVAGGWSISFGICCAGGSTTNSAPIVTLSSSALTYVENEAPLIIDSSGLITDVDSVDFNGGQLVVQIATNASPVDRLAIRNQGTGPGQIGVAGNSVTFGGSQIGVFSGGDYSNALIVAFSSANSTLTAAQALLRDITFHNISENPSLAARSIRFTLSDGDGANALPVGRTVLITGVNDPPVLLPVGDSIVNEGGTLVITNVASDPDTPSPLLTFSAISPPAGLEINTTNGLLTWTPSEAQGPGTNAVMIVVTDSGTPSLSATQVFNIVVLETNEPPILAPIPDYTIHEGIALVFTNLANDIDFPLNTLSFGLSDAPAGATLDPVTGLFSWTPSEAQGPGTNTVVIIVTDSGTPSLSVTQVFSIVVLETNEPPVLAPIPDRTIHEGIAVVFTNLASDIDFPVNALNFGLSGAPAGATLDPVTGLFSWTPGHESANTTNVITVSVTDDGTPPQSDTKTFAITVLSAPVIGSISFAEGAVTLAWPSIPGTSYRVEYKTALDETSWTELSGDISATAAASAKTDIVEGTLQRFYRLRVLP